MAWDAVPEPMVEYIDPSSEIIHRFTSSFQYKKLGRPYFAKDWDFLVKGLATVNSQNVKTRSYMHKTTELSEESTTSKTTTSTQRATHSVAVCALPCLCEDNCPITFFFAEGCNLGLVILESCWAKVI